MKKGLHPENYRLVAFKDMSNDTVFITRSCAETKETLEVDGVTYPVVKVEISNTSHPFYTGKVKLVDTAGRVDKFYQRYKSRQKQFLHGNKRKNPRSLLASRVFHFYDLIIMTGNFLCKSAGHYFHPHQSRSHGCASCSRGGRSFSLPGSRSRPRPSSGRLHGCPRSSKVRIAGYLQESLPRWSGLHRGVRHHIQL